jgi:hypothetical protein
MAEAAEKTEMPNLDKILGNHINDPDITPPTGAPLTGFLSLLAGA